MKTITFVSALLIAGAIDFEFVMENTAFTCCFFIISVILDANDLVVKDKQRKFYDQQTKS